MRTAQLRRRLGPAARATIAVLVAACVDDAPLSPSNSAPSALSYSLHPGAGRGDGPRHLVLAPGATISAALRDAVLARGGVVEWSDSDIGVATVGGLTDSAVAELAARSDVEGIERDVDVQWLRPGDAFSGEVIQAPAESDQRGAPFFRFGFQWNMRQIKADAAWLVTNQGQGALVCILDTGIDPGHLDLSGKVDLDKSTSFVPTEPFIADLNAHGTAVASLVSSNGFGMASVAPDARLCAVKVVSRTGSGSLANIIAGMMHAARAGADVINMSLGTYFSIEQPGARQFVKGLQRAVNFAIGKGTLVVASAGNGGINLDNDPRGFIHVPSQLLGVLSVGATAPFNQMNFDALASYTNFGKSGVDVMAPGGDRIAGGQNLDFVLVACSQFVCTGRNDFYGFVAGTSFAAAHAAGAAAVAESQLRRNQFGLLLSLCIILGADDLGPRGFDAQYGHGRINVLGAARCRPRHL